MKTLTFLILALIPWTVSAAPITYKFSGHITDLRDSWEEGYGEGPGFHDWWPELGDRYRGTITIDRDTLIYDEDICYNRGVCGGLVAFEMKLGDGVINFQQGLGTYIDVGGSPLSFTGWSPSIGGNSSLYDSFHFNSGNFWGVDNAYWDRIGGSVDKLVRVPEPPTLALMLISLAGIGYRQYHKRTLS